ncbi:hypothetical protein H257_08032 [Aphanomyces astaci]|uniref:Uncharacterized protein n=1 Tax=Aphanomyces astaci TaxID=112090 RepID=W4GGW9_APHAT|nr:hypothetical protein H257_08032 [Aphanomyces astaci]ETV78516.1 hypothetical protein H257_08032 [Aphanomyces astaci]RQM26718.1 hypothetical protein B5M09_003822 [Aphanomyces astaci]|eukprot:XP_009832097.1 hypothetical protein H257_08032 [Aphanomyces astaci]
MEHPTTVLQGGNATIAAENLDVIAMCRKAFCARDDILLCEAVNEVKPWAARSGEIMMYWANIADKLMHTRGFALRKDGPACKTRFEKIVKMITGGEQDVLRKSGSEDEFAERERLVMGICMQIDEYQAADIPTRAVLDNENGGPEGRKKRKANKLMKVAKRERLTDLSGHHYLSPRTTTRTTPPPDDLRAFFEYLKKRMDVDDAREERRQTLDKEMEDRRAAAEERRIALELERDRRQQEFMLRVLDMMKK